MYWGWVGPAINAVGGYLQNRNNEKTQDNYSDLLRAKEQASYDKYSQEYDAIKAYNEQAFQQSMADAASRRAAAAATEANRQKAMGKAKDASMQGYDNALAITKPYVDTAASLLPLMRDLYAKGLGNASTTMDSTFSAGNMANLAPAQSAWNTGVPVPDYLKRR